MVRFIFLICLIFTALPAKAQELEPALTYTGRASVKAVITPQSIQLEDGRIVWLAGLDFPDLDPRKPGDHALTAKKILEDFLLGQEVKLYQTKRDDLGRMNRLGQHIAHLQHEKNKIWVQGMLLELGLARVRTTARNTELSREMLAKEQTARDEELGIWANHPVLSPDNAGAHLGSFQIAQGRIESVSLKRNRLYLNFGKNWRTDFTVTIAPGDRRKFSRAAIDPMQWGGRSVRVRGWLEEYNGPMIEINHPEAIELLPLSP